MKQSNTIKLTKKQKEVVECLRGNYSIITSSDVRGAILSNPISRYQFRINNGIFWRLVKKGILFQDSSDHFYYNLTELGETMPL